jgi:hypothetical protein
MKKLIAITALSILTVPAFADTWGNGNTDVYGTILNSDSQSFMGTSLADSPPKVNIYGGFASQDAMDGFKTGRAGPEKGYADEYGSILVETGVRPE